MGRYNRVDLKIMGHQDEIDLTAAASPGMMVDVSGGVTFTQGEKVPVRILLSDVLQGKTVDDAYANGDRAFLVEPVSGDILAVLVKDGQAIAVGDLLIVDTDGKFIETTGTPAMEPFQALEAHSPSGADALIRVMKI